MDANKTSNYGRMGFRQQLALIFIAGILLASLISSIAITWLSGQTIRDRFVFEGYQTAETLASQSTLALLFHSPENVQDYAEAVLNSPDIVSIAVYDANRQPLLSIGELSRLDDYAGAIPPRTLMVEDGNRQWRFLAPVYTTPSIDEDSPFTANPGQPELIGYIQLVMGKETMHALTGDLLKTNIMVSSLLAAALLAALLLLTRRVTGPIKRLAETMHRATSGETMIRAGIEGPRDVNEMQTAFNKMMNVLEAREIELRKARDAAIETARLKGEFAATVSHELRTPLNGVLGMLELLQGMGLNARQADYLEVARSSGESLLALVNDILDFSRNDSGQLDAKREDFCVTDVLDDILGLIGGQANAKGLDIGYAIDRDCPETVNGDRDRLHQILVNLVGNAIKFTDRGEVSITVEPAEYAAGDGLQLLFEVRDTGIGIDEKAHQRIFEPFLQADGSTTRKYGGTGLGLAISKQLVEFMGGEIGVKSAPGEGSRFRVRLPFDKPESAPALPRVGNKLAGKSILIVDDSEIVRRQALLLCESFGMRPAIAQTMQEMMTILESRRDRNPCFDALLIDADLKGNYGRPVAEVIESGELTGIDHIGLMANGVTDADTATTGDGAWLIRKPLRRSMLRGLLMDMLIGSSPAPATDHIPVDHPAHGGLPRLRILIVEDNRANQYVVSGMLERLGMRPTVVSDGRQAIEALRLESFDLALMDCNMPDLDGYETTRRIRALESGGRRMPIIAMTANVQEGDVRRCLDSGMDDYLSKPLKLEIIRDKLAVWSRGKTTRPPATEMTVSDNHEQTDGRTMTGQTLDVTQFDELRETIGESFTGMLKVFVEDLPAYLADLDTSIREGRLDNVPNIAHAIKGSAANIGASRLADVSRHIESAGRVNDIDTVRMLYNTAVAESQALLALLRSELDGNRVAPGTQELHGHIARILVVDDDRSTRLMFRNILEEEGYRVVEADNGTTAIDLCAGDPPDLILMDGKMPVMDGFAACQYLKHQPDTAHIPVLIITGLEDEDSIEKAFSVGATDYIPKPVNISVLRRRISRLMHASRTEQHMHRLAYSDSLTGLPNRMRFTSHLSSLLDANRDSGKPLAVMFIDVDRFKLINDTLGHDAGDMLLKIVAERLHHCVRDGDLVARLGGDEFTIVLDDIGSREVLASIARKICTAFSKPVTFLEQEIFVTLSIGISMYPSDASDIATLMKHADTAMFNAKRYRNDFRFFEYGMEADVARRLKMEGDLRRAVDRDELLIHYQPQVEARSGKVIGVEALVRWMHPERGIVAPADFIPLAEDTGLIGRIGDQMMLMACRQLRTWLDKGHAPLRMAINLSVRQIEKFEIIDTVSRVLRDTAVPPDLLELEITESVIMEHAEDMISIFRKFKEMGIHLAIDDFGTGYSSLAYLKRFPVDILKIDRSFVHDIPDDREDIAIVTGVLAMARGLGLEVIAEGVETTEQARVLREAGCDYMQGFYFSEPLTPEAFEQKYLARSEDHRISNGDNISRLKPRTPG